MNLVQDSVSDIQENSEEVYWMFRHAARLLANYRYRGKIDQHQVEELSDKIDLFLGIERVGLNTDEEM